MKKIKKILLGNEDILAKENEDIFLDVNLTQIFNELKPDKFENDFDVLAQYKRERNNSRNFMIYGIIDSINDDSIGKSVFIYNEITSATTEVDRIIPISITSTSIHLNNGAECELITTQISQPMVYSQTNAFNKFRSKYAIVLDNYVGSGVVYLRVPGDGINYTDQIIKLDLVSYDFAGNQIDYGSDELSFNNDGQIKEINNDYPFFYGRHWIKQNIDIGRIIPTQITFDASTYSISEGDSPIIKLKLGRPSVFGNEIIQLDITHITAESNDYSISSTTITWAYGEQEKTLDFRAILDAGLEGDEILRLELTSLEGLFPGQFMTATVTIKDTTPRRYVTFNLQTVYANRGRFFEQILEVPNFSNQTINTAILRHAYLGNGSQHNYEFHEIHEYTLIIKNFGEETILPVIPGFNTVEKSWAPNEEFTFTVPVKYTVNNLQQQIIYFPSHLPPSSPFKSANIRIWGTVFEDIKTPDDLIDAINMYTGYKPYTVQEHINGRDVIITAKSTAVNLDIVAIPSGSFNIEVVTVNNAEYAPQIPQQFTLFANRDLATKASYGFSFSLPGYKTVNTASEDLPSSNIPGGLIYYLESAYSDIKHVYFKNISACSLETITTNWNVSNALVKGVLFIKNELGVITEPRGIVSILDPDTMLYVPEGPHGRFVIPNVSPILCTDNGISKNFLGGFNTDPNPELIKTVVDLNFGGIFRQKTPNSENGFFSFVYSDINVLNSMNFPFGFEEDDKFEFKTFKIKITNLGVIDVKNPFAPNDVINVNETYEKFIIYGEPNEANFGFNLNWNLRLTANDVINNDPLDYKFTKAKYRIVISNFNHGSSFSFMPEFSPTDFVNISLKTKSNFQLENSGLDVTYENISQPYYLYTEYDQMYSNYQDLGAGLFACSTGGYPTKIIGRIRGVILSGNYGLSDSFMQKPTQLRAFWDKNNLLGTCSTGTCKECAGNNVITGSFTMKFLKLGTYLE